MEFILIAMAVMIGGSLVLELVLPSALKDRLGTAICWTMMAVTMTFLGLATVALLGFGYLKYIQPLIRG
jgi:hypothetical protein